MRAIAGRAVEILILSLSKDEDFGPHFQGRPHDHR